MGVGNGVGVLPYRERLRSAQNRIGDLLFEIDTITLQENPRIEADYATKIGCLENELIRCQLTAHRAKRRLTLAQARANAGTTFAYDDFEAQMDEEFAEWERQFQANFETYLRAVEYRSTHCIMAFEDGRELSRIHRTLVKRLHPDTHPDQDERAHRLFLAAQSAYGSGDLALLRSLIVATEDLGQDDDVDALNEDELAVALEIALAHQRVVEERLSSLKCSAPYSLKERLEDPKWVGERTAELRRQIEEQREAAARYDARFQTLLKEASHR